MVPGVTDESVIMILSNHTEAFSNHAANVRNHNDRITKLEEDIIALLGGGSTLTGENGITITNDVITVDFSHSGFNTNNITESINLYYTEARARSAISGTGNISYNITTGEISFTADPFNQSLDDLSDVVIGTLGTDQVLYNNGTNWINASLDTSKVAEHSSNLYYTSDRVDDRVYQLLQGGENITLAYDDDNGTLTIDAASSTPTTIDITSSNSNTTYYPVFVNGNGLSKTLSVHDITTPFSFNPSSGDFNVVDTIKIDTTNNNISIGKSAGETVSVGTRDYSVAIGYQAGKTDQQSSCVAIGNQAGHSSQDAQSVAIGWFAGHSSQNTSAVAVGYEAGKTTQGGNSVAIGVSAGKTTQRSNSVAIGYEAGNATQGIYSVAIGNQAGETNQGNYCVAIGNNAGQTNQDDNTIILNASGVALNTVGTNRFLVKPVRDIGADSNFFALYYNPTTGEIGHNTTPTPTYAVAYIELERISDTVEYELSSWTSQVETGITTLGAAVFTTPTAGWYSLGFSLQLKKPNGGTPHITSAILRIRINGADQPQHVLEDKNSGTGHRISVCFGGSILIYMWVGDYISITTEVVDVSSHYDVSGFASLVKVD